ncbi:MAG TPA: DUF1648 domain-containing protein [Candidatus Koribacter sp.]|jgi:hypothetical protein
MTSRNWKIAMAVPWLGFAAMLLDISRSYGQLPARIAAHFNAAGVANGWMPKHQLFTEVCLISFGLLCLFTFLLSRVTHVGGIGWLVMVAEYFAMGTLLMVTHGMMQIGLGETQTLDFPIGKWASFMAGVLVAGEIFHVFALRRDVDVDHGQFVALERHGSNRAAAGLAGVAVAMLGLPLALDVSGPGRMIPAVVGFVTLICAIWAYTGFVYRLSTNGLEIRMLGVPIRFVSAAQIASVNARACDALKDFGGWGIRGIGNMRAYVWGGDRCVHIHTHAGEDIYLGSSDAQQLARELESLVPVTQ